MQSVDMFARALAAMQTVKIGQIREMSLMESVITLHSILAIEDLAAMRQQLGDHLHKKLSSRWTAAAKLSDLFFVLGALWHYRSALVSGEHLACAIKRLKAADTATGGPYSDGDDDIITNISVAIFMRVAAKPLPNVDKLLARYARSAQFSSTGPQDHYLPYLLHAAGQSQVVGQRVIRRMRQKEWQSPTRIATALTLLGPEASGPSLSTKLRQLDRLQKAGGFWSNRPSGPAAISGADIAATALVMESLQLSGQTGSKTLKNNVHRHQLICDEASRTFSKYSKPISIPALNTIEKIRSASGDFEVTLFARLFADSLTVKPPLPAQAFFNLGLASLYGWLAYVIYDDLLDGEGTPAHLPLAHITLRLSLANFRIGSPNPQFEAYTLGTFDTMDEANAWEMAHCRFATQNGFIDIGDLPKYNKNGSQLADRSFAHALGPMAVISSTGSRKQIRYAKIGLRHYLVARTLNDDMSDWLDDLQAGRISYVVAALLSDMRLPPGQYNISALLPKLQKCYRLRTQPRICRQILRSTQLSRQMLAKAGITQVRNPIYDLLDSFDSSASQMLDMHTKSQAFLSAMAKTT